MLNNMRSYYNLYPILGLLIFLYFCLISNNVLLADDLSKSYEGIHNKENYLSFLSYFMSGTNMTSRPVSAFFTGSMIYLIKYNSYYYYLSFIIFWVSIFWVKAITNSFFRNEYLATATTFLYTTIPIGTSIVFSPIMLNSALATIFFCSSVIIFVRKGRWYVVLSAILFALSFLSYEIFAPCIVIFLFLSKNTKKIFFFYTISIGLIILYKKGIEPSIFKKFYQRESLHEIFNLNKIQSNIVLVGKLIFRDLPITIYKSIISLKYFNLLDWLAFFTFNLTSFFVLKNLKFEPNLKEVIKPLLLTLFFSFVIFFMSSYKPTLFGFDNRNLGGVKLFFALTMVGLIGTLAAKTKKSLARYLIATMIVVFSITIISAKNAWVYANGFNRNLFLEVKQAIIKEGILKSNIVYIKYDVFKTLKSDPRLLLREQIFFYPWESPLLMEENKLDNVNILLLPENENDIIKKSYYTYDYDQKKLFFKMIGIKTAK